MRIAQSNPGYAPMGDKPEQAIIDGHWKDNLTHVQQHVPALSFCEADMSYYPLLPIGYPKMRKDTYSMYGISGSESAQRRLDHQRHMKFPY
jgi:hypothetical protein